MAFQINDFPPLSSHSKMLVYIDDIVLLHHVDSLNPNSLQSDINVVISLATNLKFSMDTKEESITFSRINISLLAVFWLHNSLSPSSGAR